jgi:hypothetical protein
MFLTKKTIHLFLSVASITLSSLTVDAGKRGKKSKTPPTAQSIPLTGSIRAVESVPDDVSLSLGINAFDFNTPSLIGGQLVTNARLFRKEDIEVEDGKVIGEIDNDKQIGLTTSVCTITQGTFDPPAVILIEAAACSTTTCFSGTDDAEDCFFGVYGGTLKVDVTKLSLDTDPNGILIGGTGLFAGIAGSFGIRKIVEDQATSVFQIDFSFDDIDRVILPLFS